MNENQEKNRFEDEIPAKEPLTKKVAKFSAFIYLGLAITVVVIATVGIFSISYDYEASLPEISFPEIDFEDNDFSAPQIIVPPEDSETPVVGEQSGVDAEVSDPESPETDPENDPEAPRETFYRPVAGETLKRYSMDALVFSETMRDYRVHSGIDIAAELGTEVVSFTDGTVASVTDDYFFGTTVSIAHADGMVSYYMNLDKTLAENIAVGSEVTAGQVIGTVGNTARVESADEPHLHFELRVNENLVNPESELP